ncbi:hypothetical protein HJB51_26255 [Rhizobium lentis]|uniref:hypothetical protein n=1 Tax=Rhizobium lentis TaxID=1138194 RepID=UPI001A916FC3|nr:hypothetical protein [Rhizobium lentis]MBX5043460.1 hypothetical protein [Rhizobium lentis]MBX5056218.1 hypothetical protein [Rhizobium lentis]MBX5066388.1 hypothetical protein [Rhizobium lentis]MBX5074171.1 hypothetical protein [Rhizobium lentis]MBX5077456.1 hypothetical protein [Rhizobium lentis]
MKSLQAYVMNALSDFLKPQEQVSIFSFDYWSSANGITVASTLIAAVLGALFGTLGTAAISWWLAKRTATEQLRRDEAARIEKNKAVALEMFVKAMTITNQLYSVLGLVLNMLQTAEKKGVGDLDLWQKVLPMSGITSNPDRFTAQEAAVLIGAKEFDVPTNLFLLAEKYFSLTDSINRYSERRLRLTDLLSAEIDVGGLGSSRLSKEQYQRYQGQMYELNDMAAQICQALTEDFEFSKDVTEKIGPTFKKVLADDDFPTAVFPAEAEARCAEFRKFLG